MLRLQTMHGDLQQPQASAPQGLTLRRWRAGLFGLLCLLASSVMAELPTSKAAAGQSERSSLFGAAVLLSALNEPLRVEISLDNFTDFIGGQAQGLQAPLFELAPLANYANFGATASDVLERVALNIQLSNGQPRLLLTSAIPVQEEVLDVIVQARANNDASAAVGEQRHYVLKLPPQRGTKVGPAASKPVQSARPKSTPSNASVRAKRAASRRTSNIIVRPTAEAANETLTPPFKPASAKLAPAKLTDETASASNASPTKQAVSIGKSNETQETRQAQSVPASPEVAAVVTIVRQHNAVQSIQSTGATRLKATLDRPRSLRPARHNWGDQVISMWFLKRHGFATMAKHRAHLYGRNIPMPAHGQATTLAYAPASPDPGVTARTANQKAANRRQEAVSATGAAQAANRKVASAGPFRFERQTSATPSDPETASRMLGKPAVTVSKADVIAQSQSNLAKVSTAALGVAENGVSENTIVASTSEPAKVSQAPEATPEAAKPAPAAVTVASSTEEIAEQARRELRDDNPLGESALDQELEKLKRETEEALQLPMHVRALEEKKASEEAKKPEQAGEDQQGSATSEPAAATTTEETPASDDDAEAIIDRALAPVAEPAVEPGTNKIDSANDSATTEQAEAADESAAPANEPTAASTPAQQETVSEEPANGQASTENASTQQPKAGEAEPVTPNPVKLDPAKLNADAMQDTAVDSVPAAAASAEIAIDAKVQPDTEPETEAAEQQPLSPAAAVDSAPNPDLDPDPSSEPKPNDAAPESASPKPASPESASKETPASAQYPASQQAPESSQPSRDEQPAASQPTSSVAPALLVDAAAATTETRAKPSNAALDLQLAGQRLGSGEPETNQKDSEPSALDQLENDQEAISIVPLLAQQASQQQLEPAISDPSADSAIGGSGTTAAANAPVAESVDSDDSSLLLASADIPAAALDRSRSQFDPELAESLAIRLASVLESARQIDQEPRPLSQRAAAIFDRDVGALGQLREGGYWRDQFQSAAGGNWNSGNPVLWIAAVLLLTLLWFIARRVQHFRKVARQPRRRLSSNAIPQARASRKSSSDESPAGSSKVNRDGVSGVYTELSSVPTDFAATSYHQGPDEQEWALVGADALDENWSDEDLQTEADQVAEAPKVPEASTKEASAKETANEAAEDVKEPASSDLLEQEYQSELDAETAAPVEAAESMELAEEAGEMHPVDAEGSIEDSSQGQAVENEQSAATVDQPYDIPPSQALNSEPLDNAAEVPPTVNKLDRIAFAVDYGLFDEALAEIRSELPIAAYPQRLELQRLERLALSGGSEHAVVVNNKTTNTVEESASTEQPQAQASYPESLPEANAVADAVVSDEVGAAESAEPLTNDQEAVSEQAPVEESQQSPEIDTAANLVEQVEPEKTEPVQDDTGESDSAEKEPATQADAENDLQPLAASELAPEVEGVEAGWASEWPAAEQQPAAAPTEAAAKTDTPPTKPARQLNKEETEAARALHDVDALDSISAGDRWGTLLDLAHAYMDMGETDEAKRMLEGVARFGDDNYAAEAKKLLSQLG